MILPDTQLLFSLPYLLCLFSSSSSTFQIATARFPHLVPLLKCTFYGTRVLKPRNLKGYFLIPIFLNLSATQAGNHSPVTVFTPLLSKASFHQYVLPCFDRRPFCTVLEFLSYLSFIKVLLFSLLVSLSLPSYPHLCIFVSVSLYLSLPSSSCFSLVSLCAVWFLLRSIC